MKKRGLSQETLKLIASGTMLIDHIGATLVLGAFYAAYFADDGSAGSWLNAYNTLRIIGRIAFPIYCFMLVEGFHHTRNKKKYLQRLAVGVVLSELPFDLALNGGWDWSSNSVMLTLLLGFLMLAVLEKAGTLPWKLAAVIPFYLLAELLQTDYGGHGILIIAMLALTRGLPKERLWRTAGFVAVLWFGATVTIGPVKVPIEIFGLVSLVPIFLYDGRKLTRSRAVQWAFYLFYPVHLLILWMVNAMLFPA